MCDYNDDYPVVTDEDIRKQKQTLKGKARHNKEDTNKYQRMNLNKYDIILEDDVRFSTSVYNGMKEKRRKTVRSEDGRGKWKRK